MPNERDSGQAESVLGWDYTKEVRIVLDGVDGIGVGIRDLFTLLACLHGVKG